MTYDKLTVQEFAAKCGKWRTNIYEATRLKHIDYKPPDGREPLYIIMSPKTVKWMEARMKKESVE